ncbi:hypothetical protein HW555_013740, partial [Spodoptera exigua]
VWNRLEEKTLNMAAHRNYEYNIVQDVERVTVGCEELKVEQWADEDTVISKCLTYIAVLSQLQEIDMAMNGSTDKNGMKVDKAAASLDDAMLLSVSGAMFHMRVHNY